LTFIAKDQKNAPGCFVLETTIANALQTEEKALVFIGIDEIITLDLSKDLVETINNYQSSIVLYIMISLSSRNIVQGKDDGVFQIFVIPYAENNIEKDTFSSPNIISSIGACKYRNFNHKKKCAVCGRSKSSLKLCSGCRCAYYCSVSCQKKDWSSHKQKCVVMKNTRKKLKSKMN
jgi:hypothetical protein